MGMGDMAADAAMLSDQQIAGIVDNDVIAEQQQGAIEVVCPVRDAV